MIPLELNFNFALTLIMSDKDKYLFEFQICFPYWFPVILRPMANAVPSFIHKVLSPKLPWSHYYIQD